MHTTHRPFAKNPLESSDCTRSSLSMMLSVESSCSTLSTTEGKGRKRAPETLRPVCTDGWIVEDAGDSEDSVVVEVDDEAAVEAVVVDGVVDVGDVVDGASEGGGRLTLDIRNLFLSAIIRRTGILNLIILRDRVYFIFKVKFFDTLIKILLKKKKFF